MCPEYDVFFARMQRRCGFFLIIVLTAKIKSSPVFFANRTDAARPQSEQWQHTCRNSSDLYVSAVRRSPPETAVLPSETRVEALTDVVEAELWHPEFLGEICLCAGSRLPLHIHTHLAQQRTVVLKNVLSFSSSFFSSSSESELRRLPVQNNWKRKTEKLTSVASTPTSVHTVCCVRRLVVLPLSVRVTWGPWPIHAGVWFWKNNTNNHTETDSEQKIIRNGASRPAVWM